MVLDIFALVVIAILLALVIWLVVFLGNLPGDIARKRNHPQAEAITALGWIGVITLGAGFLVAIVWAYWKPSAAQERTAELEQRIEALEQQLASETGSQGGESS